MSTTSPMEPRSERCRLLELPVELQLQIWELVVCEDRPLLLNMPCNSSYRGRYTLMYEHQRAWKTGERHPPIQPGITRTCRAIRADALTIFYRHNVFRACYCDAKKMLPLIVSWLNRIVSTNRESLEHFYFYDRNKNQDAQMANTLENLSNSAVVTQLQGSLETLSSEDYCCHLVTFGGSRRNIRDGQRGSQPGVPRLRMEGEV